MSVLTTPVLILPQLRPKQEEILKACRRYSCLTAEQITRLLWGGKSLSAAKELLTELRVTLRLLNHTQNYVRAGRGAYVYYLSDAGRRYLTGIGYQLDQRPHKKLAPTLLHLPHTLAVNDALIAVELLARRHPGIPLTYFLHERDLKRFADAVTLTDGTTSRAVPDGFFALNAPLGEERALPVTLEVDRGTEESFAAWTKKIDGLIGWYHGPYQKRFQTRNLTVAILIHDVVPDANPILRLATLRTWTAQALTNLGYEAYSENFFLTNLPPDTTDPDTLFLTPVWWNPTGETAVTLLPV